MQSFLIHAGYLALILFGFIEACSIPISSEITFGFAGVLAYEHHLNLVLVIVIGSLAELAGSSVSYLVGRRAGRPTVERFGRYVLITRPDLDRAERFFAGRGAWAVAVGRALPVIRAFVGIVAGFVEVPVLPFVLFNLLGTVVWAAALSVTGYAVGSAWSTVSHEVSVAGYIVVALVVLAVAAIIGHRLRELRKDRTAGRYGPDGSGRPAAGRYGRDGSGRGAAAHASGGRGGYGQAAGSYPPQPGDGYPAQPGGSRPAGAPAGTPDSPPAASGGGAVRPPRHRRGSRPN